MSAMVEIVVEISLDPDCGDRLGIAVDAERLVEDCFYIKANTVDDALTAVEEALIEAREKVRFRAAVPL